MTEKQYSPSAKDKKIAKKITPIVPQKTETVKTEEKVEKTETAETRIEEKKEKKKIKKEEKIIKEFVFARGLSLKISAKYSGEVCRMIMWKTPEVAIERMTQVLKMKKAVPMQRRETAHQKGRGISGGKFPLIVCKEMIALVKQAQANANFNGVENPIIVKAIANKASMPFRSDRRRRKRAHVYIELRDRTKLNRNNK